MSQFNCLKPKNCGEEGCGQNGALCEFCQALLISDMEHASITCPEKIQTCCKDHLCDMCKATAESLKMNFAVAGGKASAKPVPMQNFTLEQLENLGLKILTKEQIFQELLQLKKDIPI